MPLTRAPAPALLAALAIALAIAPASPARAAAPCPRLRIADPLLDPGNDPGGGGIVDVDIDLPPTANTNIAAGTPLATLLTHVAVGRNRLTFATDMEADPSGLGPDAGGSAGPGAVFSLDPGGTALALVADGTICGASIANCGPAGVFVDPIGLAWSGVSGLLVVVDPDSDPSGLGPDALGHAGHGALLAVDLATGRIDLVADGSSYAAGIPGGGPSIFEDPIAVAFGWDGALYVLDQLARPDGADPGALFRVDPSDGAVTLVSSDRLMSGPRDVAPEPSGTLLVLDRLVGRHGGLLRIDPALPPASNVVAIMAPDDLVEPSGVVVAGNGEIFVADTSADPFGDPDTVLHGAVFRIDAGGGAVPVSSTPDFEAPWSVDLLEPLSLDAASPGSGNVGAALTVQLVGGPWAPGVVADFGAGVDVLATRFVSTTLLEVDVLVQPAALPGLRDVRIVGTGDWTMAFHCELFEVRASGGGCAPQAQPADSLTLRKDGAGVVLEWSATPDACRASFVVRRAFTARPSAHPGTWPSDPAFGDVTSADGDGSAGDPSFTHAPVAGVDEYFLVTARGTDGSEGRSGSYGW